MKPVLVIKSPLRQEYLDYLDDVMYNPHPGFHSMRVQPTEYNTPAEARELSNPQNVNFKEQLANMGRDTKLPLSITEMGHTEPLMGRHVYPFQAFSMAPNMFGGGAEADLPRSYKIGRGNRPRNLQMYAFEGRDTSPQRIANNLQAEGIIYGDVDESNIMPVFNKPVNYADLRVAARSLLPTSGSSPDMLNPKQQSIARQMMRIGLPPVLTSEQMMIPDITDSYALDSIRDDARQWSQNQQRLNIPTEDLLYASEPMDIAMRLLKLELAPPMTQGVEEEIPMQEDVPMVETMNYNNCDCAEKVRNAVIQHEMENIRNGKGYQDIVDYFKRVSCEEIQQMDFYEEAARMYCGGLSEADQMKYTGEPMDIAFQLLKERISPEAKRHKLEYDKKYESTPERVKYREELNRERRRRGIYGSHDHKDISHTEGGKLTLEGEHENRARHFKDKGTLREL